MAEQCPRVWLRDAQEEVDINAYFSEIFAPQITTQQFFVGQNAFTIKGLRVYSPYEKHRLIYAADDREVRTEKLERYVANLRRRLTDSQREQFVYLGFIQGKYLDDNLNQERTAFSFPEGDGDGDDPLLGSITLNQIRKEALEVITRELEPFLEELNEEKRKRTQQYIWTQAPQYRPLLTILDEVLHDIPPGVSDRELDAALHEKMFDKQRELRKQSEELMAGNAARSLKPEQYEAEIAAFIEKANEFGKSSLAEYVAHRKVILDFLEKSLQKNPETGKYELEEIVHKIIYPMRSASDEVPYDQQNLWIIDERLAYHTFLASDIRLDQMEVIESSSESRPDVLVLNGVFEGALAFAEEEYAGSLVIVEFKRPERTDYGKEDPIDQIYRLLREIRTGHFKRPNGREIKVRSADVPAYAYAVCDLTRPLEQMLENKGMRRTPDGLGFYTFNDTLRAYVEVISYDKLLIDAKKRNRILFDKLFSTNASARDST